MRRRAVVLGLAVMLAASAATANVAPPLNEYHLGIALERTRQGVVVLKVEPGRAAEKAGLKTGDLILAIDRRYSRSFSRDDLKAFAEDTHAWPVQLILVRHGTEVMDLRIGD